MTENVKVNYVNKKTFIGVARQVCGAICVKMLSTDLFTNLVWLMLGVDAYFNYVLCLDLLIFHNYSVDHVGRLINQAILKYKTYLEFL